MIKIKISSNPAFGEAKYSAKVYTLPIRVTYSASLFSEITEFFERGSKEIVETIRKASDYGLESLKENVSVSFYSFPNQK
jgi:hypothetical protein